MQKSIEE